MMHLNDDDDDDDDDDVQFASHPKLSHEHLYVY